MPVLDPDHLLEQADRLVTPPGPGAPRQADLRRAISTAYYALFHAVATAAADDFAGRTSRDTPRYQLVYRSVDHGALRKLSDVLKSTQRNKGKLPSDSKFVPYEPAGGFGNDLIDFAAALGELQIKRHQADYDPLYRVKLSDAFLALDAARAALQRFRRTTAPKRKAFLALVVFSPR